MTGVATCSCGDPAPHVIARRATADGVSVEFWHDGAITGRIGRALPGVPVARPRTAVSAERARRSASLLCGEIAAYDVAELPRLYACARRVADRGGSPGDLHTAFAELDSPRLRLTWTVYATDASGDPTVRVARLDRMRWPGLVVWHERGRYELLAERAGVCCGSRSRSALEPTGFSFTSQGQLRDHLFAVSAINTDG